MPPTATCRAIAASVEKRGGFRDIGTVARAEGEGHPPATTISQGMDFASWTATRARWPEFAPAFCALCRPVGASCGSVDAHRVRQFRLRGKKGEDTLPEAAMAPSVEPVADRGSGAAAGWAIRPPTSDPKQMDDAADPAPVIPPPCPRRVPRQKRLDFLLRPIRKPKSTRHGPPPRKIRKVTQTDGFITTG